MIFADNVYQIMRNKNMKQAAVARAAGLSPNEFNALLRGRKLLREEHIVPICVALDATPNELFFSKREQAVLEKQSKRSRARRG